MNFFINMSALSARMHVLGEIWGRSGPSSEMTKCRRNFKKARADACLRTSYTRTRDVREFHESLREIGPKKSCETANGLLSTIRDLNGADGHEKYRPRADRPIGTL